MKKYVVLSTLAFTLFSNQSAVAELSPLKSLVYSNPNASPDRNAGINGQTAAAYISSILNTNSSNVVGVQTNTANILLIREYLDQLPNEINDEIQQAGTTIINNTETKLTQLDQKLGDQITQTETTINNNTENKINQLDQKLGDQITQTETSINNNTENKINQLNQNLIQQIGQTESGINNHLENKINQLDQKLHHQMMQSGNALRYDTEFKLNRLDKKLDKSIAMQSALSGLFQPYNVGKFNLTASVGGYKSHNAVAVGTGYRFNNNVAAKMGVSFIKGNSAAYNAAINLEW